MREGDQQRLSESLKYMMPEVHGGLSVHVVGRQPGPLPGVLAEGESAGQNSCNL